MSYWRGPSTGTSLDEAAENKLRAAQARKDRRDERRERIRRENRAARDQQV